MPNFSKQAKTFLILGALNGFFAVALGAFAAHGLKEMLSEGLLAAFKTGVDYQFFHAFALFAVGLILSDGDDKKLQIAGWAFATGILLFSCSLYLLAVTAYPPWGFITPFGGIAFLIGWGTLSWHLISSK